MAFHCGAPTRDGSPCQRRVRELGIRCSQHRNLGGTALHPPRHAMRAITLADPALTGPTTAWTTTAELRDRVTRAARQESRGPHAGSLGDERLITEDDKPEERVGPWSYPDRERDVDDAGGAGREPGPEHDLTPESVRGPKHERDLAPKPALEPEHKPAGETKPARTERDDEPERAPEPEHESDSVREPEPAPEREPSPPLGRQSHLERERAARNGHVGPETESESESRPAEQRPMLRKERALDPDWIGARPMFRDEAPTRPSPRIEFEPSEPAEPAEAPRKVPRIAPMRSVVLNPVLEMPVRADPDPPTLIDRMPPIDPDDLAVPDFLRPGFGTSAPAPAPVNAPTPAPAPVKKPQPAADPDPPTLIDPHPPIPADDIVVPDFVVPGFVPAQKPPLRTVLSTVLGPELWQRCYTEWGPAHCTALARIARAVDGLAPSAGTAVRSTAGAGMRWLGVARERGMLADQVADAISHPAGATSPNQARTVRLYGAAICMALNVPLRRCACHRDLERDVSGELIRLGLEELAGEVP